MSIETGASARQQETPQIPMSRRRLWGQWFAYVTGPEHVTASLRVLAAGFSIGLCAWQSAHTGLLENYLLKNELPSGLRQGILRWIGLSCLVAFAAWIAGSLWLSRARQVSLEDALRRGANLLFCAAPVALLPVLALPQFEINHTLLNLSLVSGLAAIVLVQGQVVARDWAGTGAGSERRPEPGERVGRSTRGGRAGFLVVAALSLGYILFFSIYTVAKHNAFGTNSFDLGIFDQGLYTILHRGVMLSTQHGAETINHFGRHFSPILYLLAPIYALKQDARTLLVIQSVALGAGALPVYLLARAKTSSTVAAVLLAAAYLLYPALQGVASWEYLEIALAPILLLFSLYFLETDHDFWLVLFLVLAITTQEDVALSGLVIGAYIFLAKKRARMGVLVAAGSLAYFALVTLVLMPALGHGPLVDRFSSLIPAGGEGFGAMLDTLLTNPVYVFQFVLFDPSRLVFFWQLLLPLLFLPLLAAGTWYIVLPALAIPLLTSIPEHHMIGYQYPATATAFLFFLAILAIVGLRRRGWNGLGLAVGVLVISLIMNYQYGLLFSKQFNGMPQPNARQQALTELLADVPPTASVSATTRIVPHLSAREHVYLFPIVNDADYIVFDSDVKADFWPFTGSGARGQAQLELAPYLLTGQYGVVKAEDGNLLLKKGYDTARNRQALQTLFSARYQATDLRNSFVPHDVADPDARSGKARVGEPGMAHEDGHDALTYGPYDTLFPGKYRVTFRLKWNGEQDNAPVAVVDAFSTAAGYALNSLELKPGDFLTNDHYQPFVLELESGQTLPDIEYRVRYLGRGRLSVDDIEVIPVRVTIPKTGESIPLAN